MILTVICPNSKDHKQPLNRAMEYVGLRDYQILDPAHDEVGRSFSFVLYVGKLENDRIEKLKSMSQKAWVINEPNPTASLEEKKVWLSILSAIKDELLTKKEPDNFKKQDIPDILSLKDFLNSKIGQVVEISLPDRRKLGIYPDSEKLQGEFDIEYHASTAVNIAKLFKLFDASEIIVKEL